jgi:hypothetical protein
MMYQGKQLDVLWMEDRLIFLLQNWMPFRRNAGKCDRENYHSARCRIPATWGAILNIITNKNAKNYLSATIPTVRVLWVMMMYAGEWITVYWVLKNKYFGWQLNVGQNYRKRDLTSLEKEENGMTSLLSRTDADRIGRNFIKSHWHLILAKTVCYWIMI